MANTYKIPSPADILKAQAPPTGPPVPNSGGIPTQGMAAQRPNFPQAPSFKTALPGPAPAPVPPAVPSAPSGAPSPLPVPTVPQTTPGNVPAEGGSGGPVFNFNFGARTSVGGVPAPTPTGPVVPPQQQAPQTYFPGGPLLPGQIGPDGQVMPEVGHIQPHQTGPQGLWGELWPDAQAPGDASKKGYDAQSPPSNGEMWPDATAPPVIPEAPYRVTRTMAHVPRRFEVESLGPGEGAETPLGPVYRDATSGRLKLKLNEQGKAAWRQKEQERLREFGAYPMSHDPNAPQPTVTPGQPVYDAFRGRWL